MTYTYDLNTNGCLILKADAKEREWLKELRGPIGECGETTRPYTQIEIDALEPFLPNWELDWIRPEEIGALTDAPILGIRQGYMAVDAPENPGNLPAPNRTRDEADRVTAAWGFMDYALRSFVDDLIETGKAVFTS